MKNQKESFLIIFEDKKEFNMIMHIEKEKVDKFFLLYLEPYVRVKSTNNYFERKITDCSCDNCKKRFHALVKISKEIGIFNGIGDNLSEEDTVSFICVRLDTLIGVEKQLEKITEEKIRHISLIDKEKLLDPTTLAMCYTNSGFENLLRNLLFSL